MRVTDNHSQTVGYIEERSNSETVVLDKHRKVLGYVTKHGTWNEHHRKVSDGQVPGLLLPCV